MRLRNNYGKNRNAGRKPTIGFREKRKIWRLAAKRGYSSASIKAELNLDAYTRHRRRVLKENKNLKYSKDKKKPALKNKDFKARLALAN